MILAALVAVIMHYDGLAIDFAHEAGFLATAYLILANQLVAELQLEDVREHKDRRLEWETGEQVWRRQRIQIGQQHGDIAAIQRKGNDLQDPQGRIEHDPKRPYI